MSQVVTPSATPAAARPRVHRDIGINVVTLPNVVFAPMASPPFSLASSSCSCC
jgi:hypothetical protein